MGPARALLALLSSPFLVLPSPLHPSHIPTILQGTETGAALKSLPKIAPPAPKSAGGRRGCAWAGKVDVEGHLVRDKVLLGRADGGAEAG